MLHLAQTETIGSLRSSAILNCSLPLILTSSFVLFFVLRCIYTWHGCRIQVEGQCHSYIADETPMALFVNTHAILQGHRNSAKRTNGAGPKVMVVGATDSGKSSLCTLLTNYGARMGETVRRCAAEAPIALFSFCCVDHFC